jgi:hypothetical protein
MGVRIMKTPLLLAVAVLGIAAATPASAQVLDFESAPAGALAEGTTFGGITFTSALGSGLEIGNYGVQSDGQGLSVRNDTNGNFLRGALSGSSNYLSFDFGNDDPFFTTLTDIATLRVLSGATLLSTLTMALNRDDIMNQTMVYSGVSYDNFEFAFTDAAGSPFTTGGSTGLIEVVDNFRIAAPRDVDGGVPEPSTWLTLLLGFGAIGFGMRNRKAPQNVPVSYA